MSDLRFDLNPSEREIHLRLRDDYEFFARHIQKIEPKDLQLDEDMQERVGALQGEDSTAGMIPLIFHPGQMRLHRFVTDMKMRRGVVRAALVKPRQVGWSTYIQGRAHWLATKTPGMKVFIVSHNSDSTRKFLRRARKLCLAAPDVVTAGRQVENSKELIFNNGASYAIATAGSPDAMRSDSCHFLHVSEEPYFPEQEAIMAAIMPALSDGYGSEGFRESTSRGKGTLWHQFIMESVAGQNEWEVFFDAWFNHPKHRATPPPGWKPDAEAEHARRMYPGVVLTDEQLYWRAMRIKTLRAIWLFKQEFPGTLEESFQSSADTLYPPDAVIRARRNHGSLLPDQYAPLIMGVDPARTGDRTCISFRQGRVFRKVLTWPKMDDMQLVGIIAKFLRDGFEGTPVAKCFIDYAIGAGPASRLRELGFGSKVIVVHFGGSPRDDRYLNKRTEMYMDMRDWLGDTGEHVSIPDSDDVSSDLLAIPDFLQTTGSEKIKLAPKEEIKKAFGKSPDIADSMVLTFAFPVQAESIAELQNFARADMAHMNATEIGSVLRDFDK